MIELKETRCLSWFGNVPEGFPPGGQLHSIQILLPLKAIPIPDGRCANFGASFPNLFV